MRLTFDKGKNIDPKGYLAWLSAYIAFSESYQDSAVFCSIQSQSACRVDLIRPADL